MPTLGPKLRSPCFLGFLPLYSKISLLLGQQEYMIRAAPSGAEGRHSLKGCLYVHVCACWYVCAIRIGTCMCYAYWYTCVLCLLVRMCATMLIGTHDCYANLYTCVLRMCAMLIGTHVCYAFWHTCMLCLFARMCGLIIGTHMCCAYWYADYYWQSTRHADCCADW